VSQEKGKIRDEKVWRGWPGGRKRKERRKRADLSMAVGRGPELACR